MEKETSKALLNHYFRQVWQDIYAFEQAIEVKMHASAVKDDQYVIASNMVAMLNQDYLKALEIYHLKMDQIKNSDIEHALAALHRLLEAAKRAVADKDSLKQSDYEERREFFQTEFRKTEFVQED